MLTFKKQVKFIYVSDVRPIIYTTGYAINDLNAHIYSPDPYNPNTISVAHIAKDDISETIEITYTVPSQFPKQTDADTLYNNKSKLPMSDYDKTGIKCLGNPTYRPFDQDSLLFYVKFSVRCTSSKLFNCNKDFVPANPPSAGLVFHAATTYPTTPSKERMWVYSDYDQIGRGNPNSAYSWAVIYPDLWTLYIQELESVEGKPDTVVLHNPRMPFNW
jgi:hypothetical protein